MAESKGDLEEGIGLLRGRGKLLSYYSESLATIAHVTREQVPHVFCGLAQL